MKKLKYLAAVAILCGISAVSYWCGYHQNEGGDYEAACLQADFIRYLIDHFDGETECANIGMEIEECYYEWFQELDNNGFKTKHITHIKDFEDYYWCY